MIIQGAKRVYQRSKVQEKAGGDFARFFSSVLSNHFYAKGTQKEVSQGAAKLARGTTKCRTTLSCYLEPTGMCDTVIAIIPYIGAAYNFEAMIQEVIPTATSYP